MGKTFEIQADVYEPSILRDLGANTNGWSGIVMEVSLHVCCSILCTSISWKNNAKTSFFFFFLVFEVIGNHAYCVYFSSFIDCIQVSDWKKIIIVFVFLYFCRALLTAFQAFCECVGDLEMGKVDNLLASIPFFLCHKISWNFVICRS